MKVGWLSLMSDNPQHSPDINGVNNHYDVQWSNPVVEMNEGEPLISMRTFAVAKCSGWLVSKEFPCLLGSKPSYTKLCYSVAPHPPVVSLQCSARARAHTHTHTHTKQGLQNPSVPNNTGRLNNGAAMSANTSAKQVVWGLERVASEPPTAPRCNNVYFFNRHKGTFFEAFVLPSVLIQIALLVILFPHQYKSTDKTV